MALMSLTSTLWFILKWTETLTLNETRVHIFKKKLLLFLQVEKNRIF